MNIVSINSEVLNRFSRLIKGGRLAHAYLLAGPKGIGKSETAFSVAKLVNCEKRIMGESVGACEQCSSCIKMNSGNHPDVYRIDCGDAESIKITQIRELTSRLQMRAFEAATKICIIRDIENLTAESSNALLKTLEEPSKETLMILTTSIPEDNLKTVVSRCHVMKFYPSSVPVVRAHLIKDDGLDAKSAQFLAQFSQGCIGKARELNDDGFMKVKNDVINNLVFTQNSDTYLKKVLADKAQTQTALAVLLSWFRDLLVLKSGGKQDQMVHLDRYDELLTLEKKYTFAKIDGIIEELVASLALLGENLNIKIPFILLREKIWVR
jgi:DNA polymerase-3 subunit delta'